MASEQQNDALKKRASYQQEDMHLVAICDRRIRVFPGSSALLPVHMSDHWERIDMESVIGQICPVRKQSNHDESMMKQWA